MKIILTLLVLILLAGTITTVHATWPADEAGLSNTIYPYEVNPDAMGMLWISSFGVGETDPGEVWQINPATSPMQYTKYVIQFFQNGKLVPGNPSDARRDGEYFWWADGFSPVIGRAEVANGDYLLWEVPGAETFYGSAIDDTRRFWAAEWPADYPIQEGKEPNLVQVTVGGDNISADICTFSLPDMGGTRYMAYDNPYLWLGDEINSRLLRLNVLNYHYDSWDLPVGRTTFGLTVDGEGDLWFADWNALGEFDVDIEKLIVFGLPIAGLPQMVAIGTNMVWYSGYNNTLPTVGRLDPTIQPTDQQDLSPSWTEGTLTPNCDLSVAPVANDYLPMGTGSRGWGDISYDQLVDGGGWLVLKMLEDSSPWGITYLNEMIYVVDFGRKSLVKFPAPAGEYSVFLPLILR